MSASGSAWIKPKRRTGLRPEALKDRPHPRVLGAGQRFFPVANRGAKRAPIELIRVPDGADWCEARQEGRAATVRRRSAALLAVGEDGTGREYRFLGYAARLYSTHAYVAGVAGERVELICPEWHPGHVIGVAAAIVPAELRREGAWLACRARLGADRPALVQPAQLRPPGPGFCPDLLHAPVAPSGEAEKGGPAGAGAARIVLYAASEPALAARRGGTLYLTGHPPPIGPGESVYVHFGGRVQGCATARRARPVPSGTAIEFGPDWQEVSAIDAPTAPPVSGVSAGAHGVQLWRRLST